METDVKEMQEAVKAIESVKAASGKSETEILFGGVEQQLAKLTMALNQKEKENQILMKEKTKDLNGYIKEEREKQKLRG